jgi:hypothetical protein
MRAILILILLAAAPASAEPVEDAFRRGCEARERPELRASESWTWIRELCARDAAQRARLFREAGRDGRLAILAEDCADWYARNGWRLPEALRNAPRRRQALVAAACASEAEERLRGLGP